MSISALQLLEDVVESQQHQADVGEDLETAQLRWRREVPSRQFL